MDAYKFTRMIQRHDADPVTWGNAIFGSGENTTLGEIWDELYSCLTRAIAMSSDHDRLQTVINMRRTLKIHENNMLRWSKTESDYQMWAAENVRRMWIALIEMIEP